MCRILWITLPDSDGQRPEVASCSQESNHDNGRSRYGVVRWRTRNADTVLRLIHCLSTVTPCVREFARFVRMKYAIAFDCQVVVLRIRVEVAIEDRIDHAWDRRVMFLFMRALEMEKFLWNLSTLGGAFSAMGDYSRKYAAVAGAISMNQLRIAMEMADPITVSRCKLYIALSLSQRDRFGAAMQIVRSEYRRAKYELCSDFLMGCCQGVWVKVTYGRWLKRNGLPTQKQSAVTTTNQELQNG